MIGIYSFIEKSTGKRYIGYSNNIKRRRWEHEHRTDTRIPFDKYLQSEGISNFDFEILEECSVSQLAEREQYYVKLYNCKVPNGFNLSSGGDGFIGEENGRAILTEQDIINIRVAYDNHKRRKDIYKQYEDKIAFATFANIWDGSTWSHIMPEVYTEENRQFYMRHATDGELSVSAILTDEEVLNLRRQYVDKTAKELYNDYKDKIKYQTFQAILWGRHYKHLPIYKKKEKRWINNE